MNLGPETELVEHKRSTGELKEGIVSMASILNKHGRGTLYFGVLNNGDVVGQQVSDSTLRKVSQAIAHSIAPAVYPTVERLVADGGEDYVRVTFEGPDAPYACKNVYRIRVADEDRFMEPDMLESMVLERAYRRKPWDRQSSPRPLSDVEEAELRRFVERGRRHGRIAFEHESVERTLASLGLLAANGSLTNAAEVLFCPSVDVQLKMGVFKTHMRTEALDLRQEPGTVFSLVDQAEYYIANNIRRKIVVTGRHTRDEVPEIPFVAIREAFMNAYAHRAWHRPGYVQVDVYHDAVDIISPGWFVSGQDPEDHLSGRSTSSETRNRLIAAALFRSGDIESSGLGMRKMRELCDAANVRVTYEEVPFGTKLTFHRNAPFAANLESDVRESAGKCGKVRERFGKDLSENEFAVAEAIETMGFASTSEVMMAVGLSERGVQGVLKRLAERGVVLRTGAGRSTRYKLAD